MKARVGIFLVCIVVLGLIGCLSKKPEDVTVVKFSIYNHVLAEYNRILDTEMPVTTEFNIYDHILVEYERVLEDETYTEDKWENVYDYVKRYMGKPSGDLYYSIKDITGDENAELILSVKAEEEYTPFIIYAYDENELIWACISEEYKMTIYEGGIIEYITGGIPTHFMYKQLERDARTTVDLADIAVEIIDSENSHYYKMIENGKKYRKKNSVVYRTNM